MFDLYNEKTMYERAKYFKNKFLRNGIIGILMSILIVYSAISNNEMFRSGIIIFPVASCVWLFAGLWVNSRLKLKNPETDTSDITDERISFKLVETFLALIIMLMLVLSFQHVTYASYIGIPVLLLYIAWLFSQMKMLNRYFNTKS